MQAILEDEDEGDISGRASAVGVIICAGRIGRCVKREHNGGVGVRRNRILDSGGIFYKFKKGVWWRRGRIGESGGVEKIEAGRENNRGICSRI